jgi:phosphoglycerate dehydrogenase-like enzyme
MLGAKVSGKTLGLVGMGRIGRAVAQRARHGFGMRVLYYDPPVSAADGRAAGVERVESLDELLGASDFVSLHVPSLPETRGLLNAERLGRMRRGAFLINTARGDVVDEAALADALRDGTIAGAGLDVFEREPAVHPALTTLENVVLLPHLGARPPRRAWRWASARWRTSSRSSRAARPATASPDRRRVAREAAPSGRSGSPAPAAAAMPPPHLPDTIAVLGATGRTGRRVVEYALAEGRAVRASPAAPRRSTTSPTRPST